MGMIGEDLSGLIGDLGGDDGDLEGIDNLDDEGGSGGGNQQQQGISIRIDTTPLRHLASDIRKLSPEVSREFNRELRGIGDLVADAARKRASSFQRVGMGTDRIEQSIKVRRSGMSLRVIAGGDGAPEAAPIDHGGNPGSFRHPVFGNQDVWVGQVAHPFMEPALEDVSDELEGRMVAAVDRALRAVGSS